MSLLTELAGIFDTASVAWALIGAQAVNAWREPRFTLDIDVTVLADLEALRRLHAAMEAAGYGRTEMGEPAPSGPDFVRYSRERQAAYVDIQCAKTEFQRLLVTRAVRESGIAVATPEDLVVLKLLANGYRDRIDLFSLREIPGLDWAHVEKWAVVWGVEDRLAALRSTPG